MKRLLSIVLCIVILCSCLGVSADTAAAESMEKVLVAVKSRLEIPPELTEFSGNVNTYEGRTAYEFSWTDELGYKSLNVTCDDKGRISSYHYYGDNYSTKKISAVSKQEIIDFATEFLRKTLPEAFADSSDVPVYDARSYNARGNLRYNLTYNRCKDGVEVRDNGVQITVYVSDDKLYVGSMSAYIDYDTQFAPSEEGDFDPEEVYKAAFPAEKIYRDDYTYYRTEDDQDKTVFVYRIKDNNIGYITAETGETVEPDSDAAAYRFSVENTAAADMAAGGSSAEKQMLTEAELAELEVVEQLVSADEIKAVLKKLPYVSFGEDLELANINLTKNSDDEYFYRVYFNNSSNEKATEYRYVNATVNAHDGTVTYLSNSSVYSDRQNESLTEQQKEAADRKIAEFLAAVAGGKTDNTEKQPTEYTGNDVYHRYVRLVDGIKYIDNGISVSFDAENSRIRSYSYNFSEKQFADAGNAIDADAAYAAVLEYAPLQQIYIKHNGQFVKCYTLSRNSVELDAITGEILSENSDAAEFSYTDMDGHWAQEAVQKLAEIQVGIHRSSFEPDRQMTQQELLQLLCAGMINKYYLDYSPEELYENLESSKIISPEEKSPQAFVTREDAFVYMIRIAELEKVAQLEDIYKVVYADGDKISKGKIGYAAILSGMKIINGNGGYVRPQDNITRAEAATMIYRYLLTF